jgi:hypothetical protein
MNTTNTLVAYRSALPSRAYVKRDEILRSDPSADVIVMQDLDGWWSVYVIPHQEVA